MGISWDYHGTMMLTSTLGLYLFHRTYAPVIYGFMDYNCNKMDTMDVMKFNITYKDPMRISWDYHEHIMVMGFYIGILVKIRWDNMLI